MSQIRKSHHNLRAASLADIGAIAGIWADGKQPRPDTVREFEAALSGNNATSSVIVAEDDAGTVVGFVKYDGGSTVLGQQLAPYIDKVGVLPSARTMGVGRSLIEAALDDIRRTGAATVECDAITDGGRALVYRAGFRREGPIGPDTLSL